MNFCIRLSCCVNRVISGNPQFCCESVTDLLEESGQQSADISLFPRLAAQKSTFQRRVVLQGVQGGAGGILLLKQAKQCAAAAREQDACGLMLQQQLPRRGKLPALLLGAKLLKDILQRAGNLRDASCLQGLYHFLYLGVAVGLAVAAGKGRTGADAKAGLDDKDGAVWHRRQRGKLLPNPSGAQRAPPQAEGDVRPAGHSDFF